jgi:acetyltransferase-like isoleucine patch superfamily enzyme
MSWLEPRSLPSATNEAFDAFLDDLDRRLSAVETDRDALCRDLLAQFLYGKSYGDLEASAPIVALNLDPRNITLEAEYYAATDMQRFARVKPLLWLWYNFDLSPAAQSVEFGVRFRRVLAKHVFKCVGRNFKAFPGVQFSVGYNLEVGDDVVIHRNVLVDDIGGVTLHDRASLSDYVNVYSHTHSPLESADVTLRHTTIGAGVRVTYHATVLAGATLSDDSMIGTMALVTKDVEPHVIAYGIPAQPQREKLRPDMALNVDSRVYVRPEDRKGNPDYPETWEPKTQTRAIRQVVKR